MWKRVWGALDSLLSFVGFATLVLVGLRYWRGLPVLPLNWASAPATAPLSFAPPPTVPQAPARALAPIRPLGSGEEGVQPAQAPSVQAPSVQAPQRVQRPVQRPARMPRSDAPSSGVSNGAPAQVQGGRNWEGQVAVAINNFHIVKSLSDLAAEDPSLSQQERAALEADRGSMTARAKDNLAFQTQTMRYEMFLVCNITVQNLRRDELDLKQLQAESLSLVSTEGEIFPALSYLLTFGMRHIKFPSGRLLPNGRAAGQVIFLVKRGTQPRQIVYNPNP